MPAVSPRYVRLRRSEYRSRRSMVRRATIGVIVKGAGTSPGRRAVGRIAEKQERGREKPFKTFRPGRKCERHLGKSGLRGLERLACEVEAAEISWNSLVFRSNSCTTATKLLQHTSVPEEKSSTGELSPCIALVHCNRTRSDSRPTLVQHTAVRKTKY